MKSLFPLCVFLAPLVAAAAPPSKLPNIVVIVADDLGYGDLGCYGGHAISTPQIDRLAAGGRRFTHGYAPASTCTPSRYALMTGEYAWRQRARQTTILDGDAPLAIEPGRVTLASMLKQAGYATSLVGKWHLGLGDGTHAVDFNAQIAPGPLEVGFDSAFFIPATVDRVPTVFIDGHRVANLDPADPLQVSYVKRLSDEPTGAEHPELLKIGADAQHSGIIVNGVGRIGSMRGGHAARWVDEDISDVLVKRATAFIAEHKDGPFFLYYGAPEPHCPRTPHQRFAGATRLGRRGDVIAQLDWVTGRIMDALRQAGVAENTLVVFTSDNGPILYDGYFDWAAELNGDHLPAGGLRGWKYLPYEGGTRVPFIVSWPDRIAPGADARMISLTDLLRTFATLTGQALPATAGADSLDQTSVLETASSPAVRTEIVEQAISGTIAIRVGHWKFLPASAAKTVTGMGSGANPSDPRWAESIVPADALYDLSRDPGETTNVIAEHPAEAAALRARLAAIRNQR